MHKTILLFASLFLAATLMSCQMVQTVQPPTGVPVGMVAFFMQSGDCPTGWKRIDIVKGRMLLGTTDPSLVGVSSSATPILNETPPVHQHDYSISASWSHKSIGLATGGGDGEGTKKGTHRGSGTTGNATLNLPFMQVLVCEKETVSSTDVSSTDAFPYQAIGLFNQQSCPAGWQVYSSMNGRFVVPLLQNGTLGYQTSYTWPNLDSAKITHSHSVSGKVEPSEQSFAAGPCCNSDPAKHEEKTVSGMSDVNTTILPFVYMMSCIKTSTSVVAGTIPRGTVAFYGSKFCPTGWGRTLTSAGRFLIGLPDNGNPGASFGGNALADEENRTHIHDVGSGSVSFSSMNLAGVAGCCNSGFAKHGTYSIESGSGTVSAATSNVPYVQLSQCTKE